MSLAAFETSFNGTTAILTLSREGIEGDADLRQEFADFIDEHQPRRLIIRFNEIAFFSSEMINSLLRARESVMRFGGDLKLCEMREEIRDAIARLPDEFRDIFVMRHFQELSYREICEATGLPMGTVKSRLIRARRRLGQELGGRRGT